jgi:malonyl-CoA decarboxylase
VSSIFFNDLLWTIAERGRALLDLPPQTRPDQRAPAQLAEALLAGDGEASGMALAHRLNSQFASLDPAGKSAFFDALARQFGPDRARLAEAIARYEAEGSDEAAAALHAAAAPRRQELIRRLNLAPGGTAALVAMRAELLDRLDAAPALRPVDRDFRHLFASWFNRGFLVMRRIDWNTTAAVLEKIIRYEAVHAIDDWDDLRRRIDPPDRRCYAFFHPALVDEPLIFVQVALMQGMPAAIGPILADDRAPIQPQAADTAVFYSITNCQKGLRGVSFGNFLIKQVVDDLRADLPNLKTFVTLSPVPGFAAWLAAARSAGELPWPVEAATLSRLDTPGWWQKPGAAVSLQAVLMPLAAHYFLKAKSRGKPADAVARFHLGNGARLERINWLADPSERGLRQGHGLMVNYLYPIKDIERNHEAYANEGKVVAASAVTKLLRAGK